MAASRPVNLRKLTEVVEDRDSLILWLISKGLLANQPVCPSGCGCNLRMIKDKSIDGVIWRCPRKACRKKVSLRHGSFFAGSHLSLRQIILIVYYWARNTKLSETAHEVEVSEHSLVDWFNFIREVFIIIMLKKPCH